MNFERSTAARVYRSRRTFAALGETHADAEHRAILLCGHFVGPPSSVAAARRPQHAPPNPRPRRPRRGQPPRRPEAGPRNRRQAAARHGKRERPNAERPTRRPRHQQAPTGRRADLPPPGRSLATGRSPLAVRAVGARGGRPAADANDAGARAADGRAGRPRDAGRGAVSAPGVGPGGRREEGEVEGGCGVGERADRDEVDAGLGDVAQVVVGDAAGGLELGAPADVGDDLAHCDGVMLSRRRVRRAGRAASSTSARLRPRPPAAGRAPPAPRGPPRDAAGHRDVVLLDQDRVEEPDPVVRAAARGHRRLLEHAQARRRLAGVEDPHPRPRLPDRERRRGGHARQALQQVQGRALGGQQGPGRALDHRHLAALAPHALLDRAREAHVRVELGEHGLGDVQPKTTPGSSG